MQAAYTGGNENKDGEMVMSYTMTRDDLYGLVRHIGAETHEKGNELFFKVCPYCNGGGKRDKDTFSINMETGTYHCFRASCGESGHFVQLARKFDYHLDFDNLHKPDQKRTYRAMPQRPVEAKPEAIKYLGERGISAETVTKYQISASKKDPHVIVFPFFDEHGKLTCAKYRKTDFVRGRDKNKEWFEADTEPILFGMNHCKPGSPLIITEGQIDSLSVAEAGLENAVSVPNGAQGMTWVENCWDFLQQYKDIIVFGDCEKGIITLVEKVQQRLKKRILVVDPQDYLGEKDANDILRKYGTEAIRNAVANAKEIPVQHVKELSDVKSVDLYDMEKVTTGITMLDRTIGGLYFGQVVAITGQRGNGKSTVVSQILVEARDQGYSVLAYSGELPDYHFKRWMDFQTAGINGVCGRENKFHDIEYYIPDDVINRINAWYRGKVYIYDNASITDDDETQALLDTIEQAIQQYGIRVISIDNLMTALDIDPNSNLYQAQSRFLRELKAIAVKYNVLILLVAHPKKIAQGQEISNDDVSGSADITNRVDLVLSYKRDTKADADDPKPNCTHSYIQILKNRLTGKLIMGTDKINLLYSEMTKRLAMADEKLNDKHYGWESNMDSEKYDILPDLPF